MAPVRTLSRAAALVAVLALLAAPGAAQGVDPVLVVEDWHGVPVVSGELLVQFRGGAGAASQVARHAELGATRLASLSESLAHVRLPDGSDLDAAIEQYTSFAEVERAQPNVLHAPADFPDDPKVNLQWGLTKVSMHLAWDGSHGNRNAVVAILDSGVDMDHPDLDDDMAWGWDFYAGDADPDDMDGHGTHCAGIAAAETDNGQGVAGAAWNCQFASYRCGNTVFPTSALVPAINDANAQGAVVISMSWGSTYNDPAIGLALQQAAGAGCVLVAAAGNDGNTTPFYPAAHEFVIAVGASTTFDSRASFSNYGTWVDLAAPGQSIYSTWNNGGYAYSNGTSMACPLVAGVATLLYSRLGPERTTGRAEAIRTALEQTAKPVLGNWVEHGRIDAGAAMDYLFPPPPVLLGIDPDTLEALSGTTVTLSGEDFTSATEVAVDGVPLPAFSVLDDATISFSSQDAAALGAGSVEVTGPGGTSDPLGFTWVETDPPRIEVPASIPVGNLLTWALGGGSSDTFYLLLALDPSTVSYQGQPLLAQWLLLWVGSLDSQGLSALGANIPASAAGLTVYAQIITWDGGFDGSSAIVATELQP